MVRSKIYIRQKGLGNQRISVATVCLFYIAKRWHGMWIWISSFQAVDWTCKFIICFDLWTTPCFSRSNVDTQLQRPFKKHGRNKDKVGVENSWKLNVLLFSFDITADVLLKIRYPLIHWLVITFCMNRVIYSPKSLYSIRNNCQWWLSRESRWFPTFSHKHITMLGSSGFFAVSCFCWGVRKSSKAQSITWATQIHGQDWICLVLIMKTRDTNIKWNIQ